MGGIGEVFSTVGLSPGLYAFIVRLAACILVTISIAAFFHRENQAANKKGKILQGLGGYRYTLWSCGNGDYIQLRLNDLLGYIKTRVESCFTFLYIDVG
jgi:hypothetical protein